jgi:hypothetical protein
MTGIYFGVRSDVGSGGENRLVEGHLKALMLAWWLTGPQYSLELMQD